MTHSMLFGRRAGLDSGLLSPVRAGTDVEAVLSDEAWLQAMLEAEAALARAQARLGTVPTAAALAITAAARAGRLDLTGLARTAREAANPVVGIVEEFTAVVAEQDAEAAEFVHRGSTSQDILDTAAMLVASHATVLILDDLDCCAAALTRLARDHRDTPMAGRTLSLHAVPTTFGLKAAGWLKLVYDARRRLEALMDGGLPAQLGGAAGTLAGYLEYAGHGWGQEGPSQGADRYAEALCDTYADELGLSVPVLPWHSLRTPVVDVAAAMAFLTGALGKIAVDVQSLARTEVAEVVEPAAAGRGASSAMPHKRNPVLSTLIRSAALQVPLLSAGLFQCMLTEDERSAGVWHAEWQQLRECLRLAGGAAHTAAALLEGLTVRPERMLANLALTGGQVVSEKIAAALTPALGRAEAKRLLSRAAAEAEQRGCSLGEVLAALPEVTSRLPAPQLTALLDPTRYTGAAGHLVDLALRSDNP
ncbi:3-carboxy-cis,cis-muconate cycloisomerase [Streptantibioticus ferralitis]|uniref:3-carboxy-cis,cis-muconate cycloisomerase n=1 Tax=Streptantibioticus ferralitis TaxID=236510 RepID=A0ABT5ZA65_9ACTN|nr:3-carboxy-cis,cis-muconate cycloisomerase [Streptantibioticus ferralitis]MDF2260446.1 3-carboxy-cis,cis-muconate cycloisomerase [Streptantibioticus ferralitis]